jgi:hypothetical protein
MVLVNSIRRGFRLIGSVAAMAVLVCGAIAVAGLLGGCTNSSAPSGGPVVVPLAYAPEHAKESIRPYPGTVPPTRIYIGRIEDKREKMDAIGVNLEHATPVQIVAGSDPVGFFRQTLALQLRRAGLSVTEDPAQAERTITGDLTRFWVEESNNYQGDVAATIRVSDRSGAVRWEGAVTGHGENFGRSLSPENYSQTLSDAIVRLTYDSLLPNSEFQNALR